MAKGKKTTKTTNSKPVEQYEHKDKKRLNNPPVGLVDAHTDNGGFMKKTYQYDPHLDPQLQWAGKAEHTSFDVPTVSLHVHERIDPKRIIETVRKAEEASPQLSLFETEKKPLREAIEFYKHKENWSNRLIAGDSLLVMNSLLEKEGMGGKVQMVYFDPPYGIKYGSNFQPFVNKRDVKEKDDDLTSEPEMVKAFRDTWELGIHSYLTYLRDRLLLAKDLLHETGSVFVQISDENLHHVREILDEVFGSENFISIIPFRKKTMPFGTTFIEQMSDYLIWYGKKKFDEDRKNTKYFRLFREQNVEGEFHHCWYELPSGKRIRMTQEEIDNHSLLPPQARVYRLKSLEPSGRMDSGMFDYEFEGRKYPHPKNGYATTPTGMDRLRDLKRLQPEGNRLTFIMYVDESGLATITSPWHDTVGADNKRYVVQTNSEVIKRCLLMTTEPGDLVLDITCGSGVTALTAEKWGRRWITCDTSRIAITIAKQKLISANYNFFKLQYPNEGVGSGFLYKTFSKTTVGSLANSELAPIETLYDQPLTDNKKTRVTGPFTVEAVPAPVAKSFEEVETDTQMEADTSVSRSGETLRQSNWIDELLKSGVRGKNGKYIMFSRMEPMSGTRFLQAHGETKVELPYKNLFEKEQPTLMQQPQRVVVCFGPEHAPFEQRMVELALEEARMLRPKPDIILFCAFHFDSEARKDIEETNWPGITLLEAQMNADLLTDDLKKKRSSNESFWLIGQPDVQVVNSGEWLVDSKKQQILFYGDCKKLSGAGSLAEINKLGKEDLCLYAAISQRRNLWTNFTNAQGERIHSLQYSGRSGEEHNRGIQTISGDYQRLIGRIGDLADSIQRNEFPNGGRLPDFIKRLRGDKQIAQWLAQITIHPSLTTTHLAQVEVNGFDYYNPKTGTVDSGGKGDIAMWMLDHDYDGRSLFPSQVFFPMAGAKEGWATLAKNLKAEIDEEKIEAFGGTVSLPFKAGKNVAVKIIDARGIESLKIIRL